MLNQHSYADRRFDIAGWHGAAALYERMSQYHNELLTHKLQIDLSLSASDADVLFEDVKRFIALCSNESEPLAPPRIIDQAWHHFILQTKNYSKFCNDYCERFIHHQPADPFARERDYGADRRHTRELAEAVFGILSGNWSESLGSGQCTHNCGTGE